jgi:prevent-host-death family protein
MVTVGATTLVRHFGEYQDVALREPVAITSNGRERLILLSADEYKRLKRQDRRILSRAEFTAAELEGLKTAPARSFSRGKKSTAKHKS